MPSKNTLGVKKGEAKSEAPVNVKTILNQQATKNTDIRCRPRPGLLILIIIKVNMDKISNLDCIRNL